MQSLNRSLHTCFQLAKGCHAPILEGCSVCLMSIYFGI
uniref:Uncharacterized protein n=1 Tax=Anguilla anguilla TaxID=7936 RepID=A0A0E9R9X9_ANGAN